MIYECTDCQNCASFGDGFRVVCLNERFAAEAVFYFLPVGDGNARYCDGFEEGSPVEFSMKDFDEASAGENVTWDDIRKWCERKIGEKKNGRS